MTPAFPKVVSKAPNEVNWQVMMSPPLSPVTTNAPVVGLTRAAAYALPTGPAAIPSPYWPNGVYRPTGTPVLLSPYCATVMFLANALLWPTASTYNPPPGFFQPTSE